MPRTGPSSPVLAMILFALIPLGFAVFDGCGFWPLLFSGGLICLVVSKLESYAPHRDPANPGMLPVFAGTWMITTLLTALFPAGLLLTVVLIVIAVQVFGRSEH